jgi:hypothetical protein
MQQDTLSKTISKSMSPSLSPSPSSSSVTPVAHYGSSTEADHSHRFPTPQADSAIHANAMVWEPHAGILICASMTGQLCMYRNVSTQPDIVFDGLGRITAVAALHPLLCAISADGTIHIFATAGIRIDQFSCATSATACCLLYDQQHASDRRGDPSASVILHYVLVIATVDRIVETYALRFAADQASCEVVKTGSFQITSPARTLFALPSGDVLCSVFAGHLGLLRLSSHDMIILDECPFSGPVPMTFSVSPHSSDVTSPFSKTAEIVLNDSCSAWKYSIDDTFMQPLTVFCAFENGSFYCVSLVFPAASSHAAPILRRIWGPIATDEKVSSISRFQCDSPPFTHYAAAVTSFRGRLFLLSREPALPLLDMYLDDPMLQLYASTSTAQLHLAMRSSLLLKKAALNQSLSANSPTHSPPQDIKNVCSFLFLAAVDPYSAQRHVLIRVCAVIPENSYALCPPGTPAASQLFYEV